MLFWFGKMGERLEGETTELRSTISQKTQIVLGTHYVENISTSLQLFEFLVFKQGTYHLRAPVEKVHQPTAGAGSCWCEGVVIHSYYYYPYCEVRTNFGNIFAAENNVSYLKHL